MTEPNTILPVIALDIGITTGCVLGAVRHKQLPRIHRSAAPHFLGANQAAIASTLDYMLRDFPGEMVAVVEWPINDKFSTTASEITGLRRFWESFLAGKAWHVIEVRPSTWKPLPVARESVFKKQPNPAISSLRVSTHEQDAAKIMYWFARFYDWRKLPSSLLAKYSDPAYNKEKLAELNEVE